MRERFPEKPEIPFMPDYAEWDNLVAGPGEMAASVEVRGQYDPYAEQNRTLSAIYARQD